MAMYAIGLTPLLNIMLEVVVGAVMAAFADGIYNTIPGIEKHLSSLEESIRTYFIPAITGGHNVDDEERKLLSLPPRLGNKDFTEVAPIEFENSNHFTKPHHKRT